MAQNSFIGIIYHHQNIVSQNQYLDSISWQKACYQYQLKHTAIGKITSGYDSMIKSRDTIKAYFKEGIQYEWNKLKISKIIKDNWYSDFEKLEQFNLINVSQLQRIFEKIIKYYENKGYPFAQIKLDSFNILKQKIDAQVNLDLGPLITMDTLVLAENNAISKQFLYNYLDIQIGSLYNEQQINLIKTKLNQLPYISQYSNPKVYFVNNKCIVVLYIKRKKTERLDGLIGVTQNPISNTQLLLTGEFHLDFKNLKGKGYGLALDWKNFKPLSQQLDFKTLIPYVFKTKVGTEMGFKFLKFDTSFVQTSYQLGIKYYYSGLNSLNIFIFNQKNNVQSIDTNQIKQSKKLPEIVSSSTRNYGIQWQFNNFNNIISPTQGSELMCNLSIGTKHILKDIRIERIHWTSDVNVYDSINMKYQQVDAKFSIKNALQVFNNQVIYSEIYGSYWLSPQIFYNDLERIGGANTLLGFNEQSIFANQITSLKLEYRYLISSNGYFKIFINGALVKDESLRAVKIEKDWPLGFGTGMNLETAAGIFNIAVAMGQQKNNPFAIKNAKIHFGIINYF